ncbi:unnamed protein product [Toxocara canis]|uniref:TauD domain-containing protein n=1 Tax=Toxocara canis TaxID=6265 RepID=A0A183U552_TOXCA|nr:unnamed protein product [Toxocara canis]
MDHEMGNGVLLCNVNAMALHDDAALACKQRRIKLLISFLIDRQYQRSAKDQEMLYKGLEHVLFDGLLVEEATENNEGLNGCVLRLLPTVMHGLLTVNDEKLRGIGEGYEEGRYLAAH